MGHWSAGFQHVHPVFLQQSAFSFAPQTGAVPLQIRALEEVCAEEGWIEVTDDVSPADDFAELFAYFRENSGVHTCVPE